MPRSATAPAIGSAYPHLASGSSLIHQLTGFLLCLLSVAVLPACRRSPLHPSLPAYPLQQTGSTQPEYRRTTLTSGTTVYESDYAEAAMSAFNTAPTRKIGTLGGGEGERVYIYAIPGQTAEDYVVLAGEMYPLGIFRNRNLAPFDWRSAKFQQMEFAAPGGPAAHQRSADPALIAEVQEVLRKGEAAKPPSYRPGVNENTYGLYLYTDQLPGLIYSPNVYLDKSGEVYLGFWHGDPATCFRAGPLFSAWVKTK